MNDIKFGTLANSDASFSALCLLLANHPMYAAIPMNKVNDISQAVKSGTVFGAAKDKNLAGAVLWKETSNEMAANAIANRRFPLSSAGQQKGDALAAIAFVAASPEVARRLWQEFLHVHEGRLIIYERHRPHHKASRVFKWIDKSGRPMGSHI